MAIYDKPTRILMRDMVDAFALQPGQPITKQQVIDWFAKNYPKLKTGTISAHLTRMSTNAQSRIHHTVIVGDDDLFTRLIEAAIGFTIPVTIRDPFANVEITGQAKLMLSTRKDQQLKDRLSSLMNQI